MDRENWKYKSEADLFGFIPVTILLLVFGGVFAWTYLTENGAVIFALPLALIAVAIFLYTVYVYFVVKLYVGDEGFYIRTNPTNGRYYRYSEIREAWESSGKANNGVHVSHLNIRTHEGDVMKFHPPGSDTDAVDYILYMINGEIPEEEEDDEY